ncbi:MAG: AI-2E family transporter [Verrucomicrobia bacterium]|nr:AI-2E family transporter [Deltaproteobacteria bacterium]
MPKNTKILLAVALLLVSLTAVMLYNSSTVFLQLFIAFALAYILNPAVLFLESKRVNRIISILIVFSTALVAGTGFTVFLAFSISGELSNMQLNLPAYAHHLYEITPATIKSYLGIETPDKLTFRLNELLQQARGMSPDLLKPVLAFLQKAFSSTIGLILVILGYFIIPVYLFYLLADWPQLKQFVESFVPERYRSAYAEKLGEVDTVLSGFIRGQLSVCAILAVLYSIGLYFIGIDLAIAIGTLAGITFIIPYVGTIIGIILSVIMAFLKFQDILHPLLCLGWFSLVQGLEGMVITPKVVGTSVGLHPLVAIVALLIGGQIFGLLGLLLAVPVTAVLQVFLRSLAAWYRDSEFYRGAP